MPCMGVRSMKSYGKKAPCTSLVSTRRKVTVLCFLAIVVVVMHKSARMLSIVFFIGAKVMKKNESCKLLVRFLLLGQ